MKDIAQLREKGLNLFDSQKALWLSGTQETYVTKNVLAYVLLYWFPLAIYVNNVATAEQPHASTWFRFGVANSTVGVGF